MKMQEIIRREQEPVQSFFGRLFARFPKDDEVALLTYQPGEVILEQGDRAGYIYVLIEGEAVGTGQQPHGYNYVLSEFNAVHFLGEYETIGKLDAYIASIVAKTACRMIKIPVDSYLRWMHSDPEQAFERFSSIIGTLLEQLLRERMNLFMDANDRMIAYLIEYYLENAASMEDVVTVRMTRADISDSTGYAVRTVNRNIKSLAERGMITLNDGKVRIDSRQYRRLKEALSDYY